MYIYKYQYFKRHLFPTHKNYEKNSIKCSRIMCFNCVIIKFYLKISKNLTGFVLTELQNNFEIKPIVYFYCNNIPNLF